MEESQKLCQLFCGANHIFCVFCTIEGDLFFAQILFAVSNIHTTSIVSIYTDISSS